METGREKFTRESLVALIASSVTIGFAFLAWQFVFISSRMAAKPGSHVLGARFWCAGLVVAILVMPMSLVSIWLCRRGAATQKSPQLLYILMAENAVAFLAAAGYVGYVLWGMMKS